MAALGPQQHPEGLRAYMMRSSTPAASEKVLLYLNRLEDNPPDDPDDAISGVHSNTKRARSAKGSVASSARRRAAEEHDDIRSDVQEMPGSDLGQTIPIETTVPDHDPDHEPGPDDPPGPRFESGTSFGNLGPLRDSLPPLGFPGPNSPSKSAAMPLPGSPAESHPNPFQLYGMTPATPAGIPLPPSVMSGNDAALSVGGSRSRRGATPSKASELQSNGVISPKAASRALSPTRTNGGSGAPPAERPWSPRSQASQPQSMKSRGTQKTVTNRTQYPPLPESMVDEIPPSPTQRALSPPPRSATRSPSISPSESASQLRPRASRTKEASKAKSLKSITEERSDLHPESQRGGTSRQGGGVPSQRDARSQSAMSRSHVTPVPVQRTGTTTNGEAARAAAAAAAGIMSPARSRRTLDPETTPTPSRPASPANDLNAEEARMVNDILSMRPAGTRTSYAASAAAPSMLEPEVQNSHFHDMELCQLLHALDSPMEESVKKAVRKAVRTRVKKLGMKYDNESIKQYRKSYHAHDPSVHMMAIPQMPLMTGSKRSTQIGGIEPPEWANELMAGMADLRERFDNLAPKIENLRPSTRAAGSYLSGNNRTYTSGTGGHRQQYSQSEVTNGAGGVGYGHSPMTQTTNLLAQQQTGTGHPGDESMFQQTGDGDDVAVAESARADSRLYSRSHSHASHRSGLSASRSSRGHGSVGGGGGGGQRSDMDSGLGYHPDDVGTGVGNNEDGHGEEDMYTDDHLQPPPTDHTRGVSEYNDRENSPGQQYLEEELYKLRVKPTTGSQSVATHKTWEVAPQDADDYEGDGQVAVTESGLPEIMDDGYPGDRRGMVGGATSPPLPPLPQDRQDLMHEGQIWQPSDYNNEPRTPPWQRVHQRLLSWAIVWPMGELDNALNSTTRGKQVDEVALSIWSTQTYKRYVRSKMTDSPPGRVDRLFVPPNMADAISTAVYNGRHGDARDMLRDMWAPFGLEGIPRLLIVLAKHRSDENHWVVHRFSLPDGSLTTYDTYPERCLPDGRPLGWWFAIRIAWPDAIYPSPDHLMQKMVRLHRPMQLGIDNSVAAAGIWRNLLMGSRAERSLDLERLRDLINTEVRNLRQRKQMGKLSIGSPQPNWEDMN